MLCISKTGLLMQSEYWASKGRPHLPATVPYPDVFAPAHPPAELILRAMLRRILWHWSLEGCGQPGSCNVHGKGQSEVTLEWEFIGLSPLAWSPNPLGSSKGWRSQTMTGITLTIPGNKFPWAAILMSSQKSKSVSEVKLPVREEVGQDVTKTTGITAGLQRMADRDSAFPSAGLWGWGQMLKDSCTAQLGWHPLLWLNPVHKKRENPGQAERPGSFSTTAVHTTSPRSKTKRPVNI